MKDAMDTLNALRNLSNEDSLPSWWTDKITLAKDYVGKSRDYIMNPAESVDESVNENYYVLSQKKGTTNKPEAEVFKSKILALRYAKSLEKTHVIMFLDKKSIQNMKNIKVKNESLNEQKTVEIGSAYDNNGEIELVIDKARRPDSWSTVNFDLTQSFYSGGGSSRETSLERQKKIKLKPSQINKIKKIIKNPEDKHYIENDNFRVSDILNALKRNK